MDIRLWPEQWDSYAAKYMQIYEQINRKFEKKLGQIRISKNKPLVPYLGSEIICESR